MGGPAKSATSVPVLPEKGLQGVCGATGAQGLVESGARHDFEELLGRSMHCRPWLQVSCQPLFLHYNS